MSETPAANTAFWLSVWGHILLAGEDGVEERPLASRFFPPSLHVEPWTVFLRGSWLRNVVRHPKQIF